MKNYFIFLMMLLSLHATSQTRSISVTLGNALSNERLNNLMGIEYRKQLPYNIYWLKSSLNYYRINEENFHRIGHYIEEPFTMIRDSYSNYSIISTELGGEIHFLKHFYVAMNNIIGYARSTDYMREYSYNNNIPFWSKEGLETFYPGGFPENSRIEENLMYRYLHYPFSNTNWLVLGSSIEIGIEFNLLERINFSVNVSPQVLRAIPITTNIFNAPPDLIVIPTNFVTIFDAWFSEFSIKYMIKPKRIYSDKR